MSCGCRVGMGWDIHKLVEGRRLVLGGVEVPHEKGLLGHTDGDVILHALSDAILGASGLGDIGDYFAPDDPKYKDLASTIILHQALAGARHKGFVPSNVDIIVRAQEPKLGDTKKKIALHLATLLGLSPENVNLKAKTTEGLGPVGTGEAMDCHAVVLMRTNA